MPIYLDVQGAQSRDSGHRGIGRYVLELAGAIERSEHAAAVAGYVTNPDLAIPPALAAVVPAGRLISSADVEFRPGDVFHLTSPFEEVALDRVWPPSARAEGVRLVVTVYDLIPLIYPEHYLPDPSYHARYKNRVELIRLADRVLAISHATGATSSPCSICRRGRGRDRHRRLRALPAAGPGARSAGCRARPRRPCAAATSSTPARWTSARTSTPCSIAYSRLPRALRAQHQLVIVSRLTPRELEALGPRLRALDIERDVVVASAVGDDDLVRRSTRPRACSCSRRSTRVSDCPLPRQSHAGRQRSRATCRRSSRSSAIRQARFDPTDPESLRRRWSALDRPDVSRPPAALDPRHTWPSVVERMIEECARLDQIPAAYGDRRASSIAALAAGEDAPWLEAGHRRGGRAARRGRPRARSCGRCGASSIRASPASTRTS